MEETQSTIHHLQSQHHSEEFDMQKSLELRYRRENNDQCID
jgi:hypothetical protein